MQHDHAPVATVGYHNAAARARFRLSALPALCRSTRGQEAQSSGAFVSRIGEQAGA